TIPHYLKLIERYFSPFNLLNYLSPKQTLIGILLAH
ncbi:hypothetical protein Zm00014a_039830, partial [Zea mays]